MIDKTKIILYALILILISYITADKLLYDTNIVKIIMPKIEGKFNKPTQIVYHTKKDSIIYKEGEVIFTENPINKELAEKFKKLQKEKDSLNTFRLYVDAIQEKEQTQIFDNKDIRLEIKTKTRGTLLNIEPIYTIKEREEEIEVKQKQSFSVYLGADIKSNVSLDNVAVGVNLGLQNKKGNIINIGLFSDKSIQVGYKFRIFNK